MKFQYCRFFLLFTFLQAAHLLQAQTTVAPLFEDHMVLQQQSKAALWGRDQPGTTVQVKTSWGARATAVTGKDSTWKLFINTGNAGGPYELMITGSRTLTLKDVLLGEVWLCSGQSNMEMPLSGFSNQPVMESNSLILNSFNPQLRLYSVKSNAEKMPSASCQGDWKAATPETVARFSAVAYLYGQQLQQILKVPVGIICSSVGGTRVEAWTKTEVLKEVGFEFTAKKDSAAINKNDPSVLYNAMIHPLIPYTLKGMIWYQGESNRNNYQQYKERFSAMIHSWRKDWDLGNIPFYFVQIAPFEYGAGVNSAYLREAQLQTTQATANTGMAVTLDIGDEQTIHPAHKKEVAQRLAYWALAKTYGIKGIQFSGPVYRSMKVVQNKIQLSFDEAAGGLSSFGRPLEGFTIAGADQQFHPAKAAIEKGVVTVYSDAVAQPVAVRYGWQNFLTGTLFNTAGLPASSFRTDDW